MNKTVNINLGGMFFHIDEDAYQKLTRYFDAIKRSLSNSSGQDEIIKDIEMRIGELIMERHTNDKQVINSKEVDEIITIMGQPEDYRIDNDDEPQQSSSFQSQRVNKKLYRDRDRGMIGGVAAGLSHYFGIDAVWLRIFLVILVFAGFGSGIIAYIVLWIVMPEAVTTAEKLEMTGEPVTISNIEKKVREEFDTVSEKFRNANYDKMGNQVKTGADKFFSTVGNVFMAIFKVLAKILGVILIKSSIPVIVMLLIGVFTLGSSVFTPFPWANFIEAGNYTEYPIWSFGLLMFFAVGIPFFYLMLLGFKLLITNMKSMGNLANYGLLALWIISIAILISILINQSTQFAVGGKIIKRETLNLNPNDTLYIKFQHNPDFANDIYEHSDFMITQDSANNDVIFSTDVELRIEQTDEKLPYIQIEKRASGKMLSEAKKTAEKIQYGYKFTGNQLILNNYLLTEFKNKFRKQEVDITLYLPKGVKFKAHQSVQNYDVSNDEYFNLHYSSDDYLYKVEQDQVKCLNCPSEENEYGDIPNATAKDTVVTTTTRVVNEKGEVVSETIENKGTGKGLTTDANGVIIKK